jgi:Trypsin
MATIAGFGIDQTGWPSSTLKFTDLKIMSNSACVPYFGIIAKEVLCAKSTNSLASTCPGDSGSSLILKESGTPVVVGVVSYGHAAGCDKGELTSRFQSTFKFCNSNLKFSKLNLKS